MSGVKVGTIAIGAMIGNLISAGVIVVGGVVSTAVTVVGGVVVTAGTVLATGASIATGAVVAAGTTVATAGAVAVTSAVIAGNETKNKEASNLNNKITNYQNYTEQNDIKIDYKTNIITDYKTDYKTNYEGENEEMSGRKFGKLRNYNTLVDYKYTSFSNNQKSYRDNNNFQGKNTNNTSSNYSKIETVTQEEIDKITKKKDNLINKLKDLENDSIKYGKKHQLDELNKDLKNLNFSSKKKDFELAINKLDLIEKNITDFINQLVYEKAKYKAIEITANSIMQALYDSDYNVPTYGDIEESGSVKGIRVRADVPSEDGKGNIKIDIDLNGQTTIEIENVPNGEEKLCKNTIKNISSKLKEEGLDLEITDWGRAANVKEDDGMAVEEVDNRGKTRERMERDE